jgi:hypothetical protein
MNDVEFLALMQRRSASIADGPSTIRNMLPAGSIQFLREHLRKVDISSLSMMNPTARAGYDECLVFRVRPFSVD